MVFIRGCQPHCSRGFPLFGNLDLSLQLAQRITKLLGPMSGAFIAAILIINVAALDYLTGYEVRLSILYLVPIAVAVLTGGVLSGICIAFLAVACWLVSFHSGNFYTREIYYLWEAAVMLASFVTFALLLAWLRTALAQADARFTRVLQEMDAAVYVVDERDDRLLYTNPGLAHLTGLPTPACAKDFECRLRDAGEDGNPASGQDPRAGRTVRDAGSGRWYLLQTRSIPWDGGREVSLRVLTDITEQHEAEAMRDQHRDMLHKKAQLTTLAEIALTLAHEINQPLMVIATCSDACIRMLAAGDFDREELALALEKCRIQATRAAEIIRRLRDFIRQRQPNVVLCDSAALVTEVLALLARQIEKAGISIVLNLPDRVHKIAADRTLLIQVMMNLIQNAIEAMDSVAPFERGLCISLARSDQGEMLFTVADNGAAIDEEQLARLFTPFFTTKPQGLGLGLTICRSIAEAHGGTLSVKRNLPQGLAFTLLLPIGEMS